MTLALLIVSLCGGCQPPPESLIAVKGVVTLDGRPLESGVVQFQPAVGQIASGTIGPGGQFALSTPTLGQGVRAGTYRVTVSAFDSAVTEPTAEHLIVPLRYTRSGSSGLAVTIFEGSTAPVEIALQSESESASPPGSSNESAANDPDASIPLAE